MGRKWLNFQALLLAGIVISLSNCRPVSQPVLELTIPVELGDGFRTARPVDAGMDNEPIQKAVEEIREGRYGEIHSFLVYRDGLLVVEEYFPGHGYDWSGENYHGRWIDWDEHARHNIHSVGKSITSACVGIAVEKGMIASVEDPIWKYLPDYQDLITAEKGKITIEHLLTMTSGLEWDEWGTSYASGENDVIRLWLECEDPVACILQKPLLDEPGRRFTYSGGNMVLLGEIIKNAAGMDVEAFSWEYLFKPLGIKEPPWSWITEDVIYAGGDQLLTSREMLKFGILYLNGGFWDGQRLLPDGWVENSAQSYGGPENEWWNSFLKTIPPGDSAWGQRGYGYTWWNHILRVSGRTYQTYYALGFGGQRIYILPEQGTVVVLTSGNYTVSDATFKILEKAVLKSIGPGSLPE